MATYIPSLTNAAISNRSIKYMTTLPKPFTSIRQQKTTRNVQQVSPGRLRQALSGHESLSKGHELYYGGGERDLTQRDMFCKFPRVSRYAGVGNLKRRSRGVESIAGVEDEEQEVSSLATASGESDAEDSTMLLSDNSSSGDKRIFIFGFGYTSCALASYLKNDWKVSGTCRSEEKRAALEQCGYSAHSFNSDNDGEELRDEGLRELEQASHWLISVPPGADFDSDPVLTRHVQDLHQALGKGIVAWIGYLSSTGVYGDWTGDWVDEASIPRPVEQKALARLAAEESWLKFGLDHSVPVHVFRLGGIYGPGRSAIDTVLQKQAPTQRQRSREERRFTPRIHVTDVCQTVLASMQNPCPGRIYNVVDDDPASRTEVMFYATVLFKDQDINSHNTFTNGLISSPNMALGGSNSSNERGEKRVSNKRIKVDLQVKLHYPTYREGLKAILEAIEKGKSKAA